MKDPLGVSPSKGNQGTTEVKKKNSFNGRSNPEVVGSIPTEVKKILSLTSCGSLIPFTRANAQWVFHGLHMAL